MFPNSNAEKLGEEEYPSEFDFKKAKKIKWYDELLLNRPSKVVITLALTAVIGPLLIYRFLFFATLDMPPSDGFSIGSCLLPRDARLPCGIGYTTEAECHQQCCYDPGSNLCFHRLPSRFSYLLDGKWSEGILLRPRISTVPYTFQNSITNLKLSIDEQSPTHLTLTFYDARETTMTGKKIDNKHYMYDVASPELNVVVNSTQGTIFNTARGPLIASNNIWEITFQLTQETMYGLGEIPLKSKDTKVLYNHRGGLNSVPLIYAKINDSYHGVLIDTDSPTEVSVQGNNNIVVRSITTSGLKLHVFVGPEPKNIMKDAMTVMNSEMKLQYWMLGAHICRDTSASKTIEDAYENLRQFINTAITEKLPFESHCGTGPVVFNANKCDLKDAEYIQKGIDLLKEVGKRFVPHVSPYIRFNKNLTESDASDQNTQTDEDCYTMVANNENLFYRHHTSYKLYQGLVGNDKVLYPNYEDASENFMKELWTYEGSLDGVVLENSWPLDHSNKTHNETAQALPYYSQNISTAFNETPPWNLKLINNAQIYLQNHNRYGNNFAKAFRTILASTSPAWSSSPWMNTNLVTNRQNIDVSWTNLHQEIIEAALGGISGNWLWSSPTCGDTDNFDIDRHANLCVKWYMASTFFPMLKIHSRNSFRDPYAFEGTQKYLIIGALKRRLNLLPYIYTTLQGGPLLRPMFYQFPTVNDLANVTTQFSVGDDLIIVPNLQPLQRFVHFWLPPGIWYEQWSGLRLEGEVGEAVTMSTTEADFLTVMRGGSVIVMQKDTRETAEETRLHSSMSLTIALDCENDRTQCQATGQVFVESDTYIVFEVTENNLIINIKGADTSFLCDGNKAILANTINEIYVFGLERDLNNFDHHKHIQTTIDLCNLEVNNKFPLI